MEERSGRHAPADVSGSNQSEARPPAARPQLRYVINKWEGPKRGTYASPRCSEQTTSGHPWIVVEWTERHGLGAQPVCQHALPRDCSRLIPRDARISANHRANCLPATIYLHRKLIHGLLYPPSLMPGTRGGEGGNAHHTHPSGHRSVTPGTRRSPTAWELILDIQSVT